MNGALMRASSRFAVAAALGLFMGASSSQAADLGGNCCADLEERIAELEATTARKGNRKMSLTISGQVDRAVVWYDDGKFSKTYYGLDNTNSSTRFIFSGNAKVTPKVSMGFEIMIEIEAGGTSSKVNQFDEDGKLTAFIPQRQHCRHRASPSHTGIPSFNAAQHRRLLRRRSPRRMVVRACRPRQNNGGSLGECRRARYHRSDRAASRSPASNSFILLNGGFFLRGPGGQVYNMTWGTRSAIPPTNNPGRTEEVRYDSPSWHGFIYSASIAEAGDYWGTMLRYANEFNGVRIAGSVGYERVTDIATPGVVDPNNVAYTGRRPDITAWGIALSAMHVPTGLFIQGHYNAADFGGQRHRRGEWVLG